MLLAAERGHKSIVAKLLEKKLVPASPVAVMLAAANGHIDVIEQILATEDTTEGKATLVNGPKRSQQKASQKGYVGFLRPVLLYS